MSSASRITVAAVACAAAATSASTASATRGVAIDIGRIVVSQALAPGRSYRLPSFGVRNPGTEPTTYLLEVSSVQGQQAKNPDPGWFHFSPRRMTLAPGKTHPVEVRLTLPAGAKAGRYEGLLGAQIASSGHGTQIGAAAAAHLSFRVAPAGLLERVWNRLQTVFDDWSPWSSILPGLLVLGFALERLRRRWRISVVRRT